MDDTLAKSFQIEIYKKGNPMAIYQSFFMTTDARLQETLGMILETWCDQENVPTDDYYCEWRPAGDQKWN